MRKYKLLILAALVIVMVMAAPVYAELIEIIDITGENPISVPEPATMFLLGTGLIGLVGLRRQRMKK